MREFIDYIPDLFSDQVLLHSMLISFLLAIVATSISAVLGVFFGLTLERKNFLGKPIIIRINNTLMGMPPVVIGLVVYILLMRRGPLGHLSLLFTFWGMVIAQVLIITPIVSGMIYSYANKAAPSIRVFAKTMGTSRLQGVKLLLKEMRHEIYFAIVAGFGRSISEVGAVMIVGGNIAGRTRTMTTAISTLSRQGIFRQGIALGITLMVMAFILQSIAANIRKKDVGEENH